MTTQHTPTPWQHGEGICEHKIYSITRPELDEIARCYGDSAKEAHDNAAFIVRACNAHEGLVEAVEKVRAWLEAVIASDQYPIGAPTAVNHLVTALAAVEAK